MKRAEPTLSFAATPAVRWTAALAALVLLIVAILALYRTTAIAMVQTWSRTETFTHGFIVPPISLWLIWRMRGELAQMQPRPNAWALVAIAATGFAWLAGEVATVGVVSQFAFTTLIVLCVPAVLGIQVACRIAFPLAFLYFAVPFGEFALPTMMEWTANATVLGLRLTGIPVFREGLQFVIPSGNWSVVEACSGVRYLIASLCVGTLFAYLNYRSLTRRLIFVAVAIIVPVLANWMRAYIIVMLGHLSGNKLAAGVDHLVYGWLFFGIVIMVMFWIGSYWREDEARADLELWNSGHSERAENFVVLPAAALAVMAIWPLALWQIDRELPPQLSEVAAVGRVPGWSASDQKFADWSPRFDNAPAIYQSAFVADAAKHEKVGVYIAYYRNQDYNRKMVSSENVLVRSNDPLWARVASASRELGLGTISLTARSAELRAADAATTRLIVWQWYWINGRLTASDHLAKAYTALSRLTGQGDDSAAIFLYALKDAGGGEAALASFAAAAGPAIESALMQTREKR